MSGERFQLAVVLKIIQVHQGVAGGAEGQDFSIGAEGQSIDGVLELVGCYLEVGNDIKEQLPGCDIPEADRQVGVAESEPFSVGAECQAGDGIIVLFQNTGRFFFKVPDDQPAGAVSCRCHGTGRVDGNAGDRALQSNMLLKSVHYAYGTSIDVTGFPGEEIHEGERGNQVVFHVLPDSAQFFDRLTGLITLAQKPCLT